MKLVQSILTKNPCYTAGRKITVKGLMLHSVGCPQPKASVFIKNWNSPSYDSACVHGFIDGNDGTVYQTLPWNHRGWHCGSGSKGSGNNTHIGVEMCEPACIKYTGGANFICSDTAAAKAVAKRTYEAAVELFAMKCADENPGYSVYDESGKAVYGSQGSGNGFSPYLVQVSITDLNIRKGPGTNYGKTGKYTGKGVFTIVEEASGQGASRWGRLKSGAGWISLDYAKRI